jgi:hypothetical protein
MFWNLENIETLCKNKENDGIVIKFKCHWKIFSSISNKFRFTYADLSNYIAVFGFKPGDAEWKFQVMKQVWV